MSTAQNQFNLKRQTPAFEIGLSGGMALCNAKLEYKPLMDIGYYVSTDTSVRKGFASGLKMDVAFYDDKVKGIYLDFSPFFITRGYYIPVDKFDKDHTGLVTLSYMSVPAILKFRFPWFFYIGIGVYMDVLLSTEVGLVEAVLIERSDDISLDKNPTVNRIGGGWSLRSGLEFKIGPRFILHGEFGADFGFSNVRNSDYNENKEDIKLRSYKIEVGFRIKTGK